MTSAYLLVIHGSRALRPQIAAERLAYIVKQQLSLRQLMRISRSLSTKNGTVETSVRGSTALLQSVPSPLIETASLELTSVSLSQRIQQLGEKAKIQGIQNLKIIPLFLLPGVHVREDIPEEVAIARQHLGKTMNLELMPYLGSHCRLTFFLSRQFEEAATVGKILIAHGSRYGGGNQPIESIAHHLQALPAYWSISPSLINPVNILVREGKKSITIVPYFLFAGRITTAIAQQVKQLQLTVPQIKLKMGSPLGATPELARLIIEIIQANLG
ncbi:cobalamin (vitamin B12) biosynthesis CbiX protein [cyanobacterium endosymbiont of Rhopalodia gibberula]|uniref:sirohydrochlorin chelatase n=1 Tax=cyanobacterium endosymbiont of Rhopalodia gibberula TaxID=1763363 RepID=UPI000DC6DDE9|nr:sirohydrochlorin chelatase [cyanobacterium endosymbiont of Rhopalodia gibberula]BBA80065.1 cobalamin (vitamin B12) biosynthesis CbiX protein [cyanobacterium endosymbiont of Rhopalodia gibberula]